jgi:hypothetical protein
MKYGMTFLAALVCVIFFSACNNPIQKPHSPTADSNAIASGTGRVIIGQAESQTRTILPQTPVFVSYLLNFQYQGEGEASKDDQTAASLPYSVDLLPGPWLVTVTAYTRIEGVQGLTDGTYPAASGSTTVTVSAGVSVPVTVNLQSGTAMAGQGVFEYDIGLPNESIGGAVLRVLGMNKAEISSINLLESASGSIVLDAGYYLLQVQVATGRARSKTELIHIYSGNTTRAAGSGWNFNTEEGVYLSVAELSEFLAAAPSNTADTPYPVKLIVNMESLASSSGSSNRVIVLGAFFNALHGKYVAADLSGASGSMKSNPADYTYELENRDKLISVILPDSLTHIGYYAFYKCTSLKSISFPGLLRSIGTYAFYSCSNLVSIDLSGCTSLITISGSAFGSCSLLEEVKLSDSIETIGGYAFASCINLKEMVFPASLRKIGVDISISSDGTIHESSSGNTGYTFRDSVITKADFSRCSNFQEFVWWGIFLRCENLKEVILPPAATSLGAGIFFGCTSLGEVALPAAVETIDSQAFDGCTNLVLTIPANSALKSIGANAFRECSNYLTAMDFSGLANLTGIDLSGYTELETLNLSGCSKLASVNGTDLTALKNLNLSGCTQLNSVTVANLAELEEVDLSGTRLTSINLTGCNSLGILTLSGCAQLTAITSPNLVNLKQVNLSGCTALSSLTFSGCTSLEQITIPASCNISVCDFRGCKSAVFSLLGSGNLTTDETGKILTGGGTLFAWNSASGNVAIPEGITAIKSYALDDSIDKLTLPVSVKNLANITGALMNIPSVQTLDFSSCTSITEITDNVFANVICANALLIFPSSLQTILSGFSGSTFKTIDFSASTELKYLKVINCSSLETMILPVIPYIGNFSNDSDIGDRFSISQCPSLTNFIIITEEAGYFRTAGNGAILFNKNGRLLAYPSAKGDVVIPEGITAVDLGTSSTFANNKLITSVSIPSTLTNIDSRTFSGCENLTVFNTENSSYTTKENGALLCSPDGSTLISWPSASGIITTISGVKVINGSVFASNANITAIDFSGCTTLTSIDNINSCPALTTVNLSGCTALTSINVMYCRALTTVNLSDCSALTVIGGGAFLNCTALTTVNLSGCSALTAIGSRAFTYCTALTTVNLSGCSALATIGNWAFEDCRVLTFLDLSGTVLPPKLEKAWNESFEHFANTPANLVIYVPAGSVTAYQTAAGWSAYAAKIQAKP